MSPPQRTLRNPPLSLILSFSFFLSLSLSLQLITQHVVVVVNLPSQAGAILYKCTVLTQTCEQLNSV